MNLRSILVVAWLLAISPSIAQATPDNGASAKVTAVADGIAPANGSSALVGQTWQLVEIASMNDQVDRPDDRSRYTLVFASDGTARVRADCNRSSGQWTSAAPGQLRFSELATTRARCPPGSLHDSYLAQFPWVRSYVTKGGHLFLATMADGSIIEFEPMASESSEFNPVASPPLAAIVLGEEVRTTDPDAMQDIVLSRLFDRYAEQQGIEVTAEELNAFLDTMEQGMRARRLNAMDDLTPAETKQANQMRRDMGRSMIRQWKLNRALHAHYGGRIIFQQLGPEPLDAYRQYLEERQTAGDLRFFDSALEQRFWRYFTSDEMHDFMAPGSEEASRAFKTPPWASRSRQ